MVAGIEQNVRNRLAAGRPYGSTYDFTLPSTFINAS